MQPVAHFVAGQSLGQTRPAIGSVMPLPVGDIIAGATLIGEAVILQRPVHGLDDITALTKGS